MAMPHREAGIDLQHKNTLKHTHVLKSHTCQIHILPPPPPLQVLVMPYSKALFDLQHTSAMEKVLLEILRDKNGPLPLPQISMSHIRSMVSDQKDLGVNLVEVCECLCVTHTHTHTHCHAHTGGCGDESFGTGSKSGHYIYTHTRTHTHTHTRIHTVGRVDRSVGNGSKSGHHLILRSTHILKKVLYTVVSIVNEINY